MLTKIYALVNGVISQAPMHSRANTVWRVQARTETHGHDKDTAPNTIHDAPNTNHDDAHGGRNFHIRENRVSNLLQALLCGVCLLITPVLAQIPRSVHWDFLLIRLTLCSLDRLSLTNTLRQAVSSSSYDVNTLRQTLSDKNSLTNTLRRQTLCSLHLFWLRSRGLSCGAFPRY